MSMRCATVGTSDTKQLRGDRGGWQIINTCNLNYGFKENSGKLQEKQITPKRSNVQQMHHERSKRWGQSSLICYLSKSQLESIECLWQSIMLGLKADERQGSSVDETVAWGQSMSIRRELATRHHSYHSVYTFTSLTDFIGFAWGFRVRTDPGFLMSQQKRKSNSII